MLFCNTQLQFWIDHRIAYGKMPHNRLSKYNARSRRPDPTRIPVHAKLQRKIWLNIVARIPSSRHSDHMIFLFIASLFSKQLRDLLDYCKIQKAVIIGFSLGGMIARRFAQDAPQKSQGMVILHSPHRRSKAAQAA